MIEFARVKTIDERQSELSRSKTQRVTWHTEAWQELVETGWVTDSVHAGNLALMIYAPAVARKGVWR